MGRKQKFPDSYQKYRKYKSCLLEAIVLLIASDNIFSKTGVRFLTFRMELNNPF